MANTSATVQGGVFNPILTRVWTALTTAAERVYEASEGARCAREAMALHQLSDAELAARGLTRDDIVTHAFRGLREF